MPNDLKPPTRHHLLKFAPPPNHTNLEMKPPTLGLLKDAPDPYYSSKLDSVSI
jgi:hypothetical protein